MLPTLGYGIFLGLSQGMWHLTAIGLLTMLIWILIKAKKPLAKSDEIELGLAGVAVGGRRLRGFSLFWPTWLNLRLLRMLERPASEFLLDGFLDAKSVLKAGIKSDGEVVSLKPSHTLIIGPTGSGKTEFLRNLIESWPERLVVIDFKGGLGFSKAFGIEWVVSNQSDDFNEFLEMVENELSLRERDLAEGINPKPMMLLVDELASVVKNSAKAAAMIDNVATKGRGLGVYLFAASQTLSGVSRALMANCLQKIGVGAVDQVDAMQMGLSKQRRKPIAPNWASAQLAEGQIDFNFPLGQSQVSRISQSQTVGLSNARVIDLSRVRVQASKQSII